MDTHDILIAGGFVVDGTGSPRIRKDVSIDGSKVSGIFGPGQAEGTMVIDAKDKIVCPGFIDIHTHSDVSVLASPMAESRIYQGVTTDIVGNCGGSPAPVIGDARATIQEYADEGCVDFDWVTVDEYLLRLGNVRTSVNVGTLVGADTLRLGVIGPGDVLASDADLGKMNLLLTQAMLEGAFGLSSGLIYAPGCFATTDELVSLATTSAAFGGLYASHIRGEARTVVESVKEAIEIGRRSGSRVQISHHKAVGKNNWGLVNETIALVEMARIEGIDVAFDVYPYTASCTDLLTVLPPWVRDGGRDEILRKLRDPSARDRMKQEFGDRFTSWENTVAEDGWENIVVSGFHIPENSRFENMSIDAIAKELGKDPEDAALDLLVEEGLKLTAVFHEMLEEDVETVIRHPLSAIGSDGESTCAYGPSSHLPAHPRSYGAFARAMRIYALDRGTVTVEEMVRKMTSWPASRIGLRDRGMLATGAVADIVVFDPASFRDTATFEKPHSYSKGVEFVLVSGILTLENGEHTKARAGQVLRHPPRIS
jgi:N-acyl-D-amino-acid deacylase